MCWHYFYHYFFFFLSIVAERAANREKKNDFPCVYDCIEAFVWLVYRPSDPLHAYNKFVAHEQRVRIITTKKTQKEHITTTATATGALFVISIILYIASCHYKLYSAYLRPLHLDLSFSDFFFLSLLTFLLLCDGFVSILARDFLCFFFSFFFALDAVGSFSLSFVHYHFIWVFFCDWWQTTPIFSFRLWMYACISLGKYLPMAL